MLQGLCNNVLSETMCAHGQDTLVFMLRSGHYHSYNTLR